MYVCIYINIVESHAFPILRENCTILHSSSHEIPFSSSSSSPTMVKYPFLFILLKIGCGCQIRARIRAVKQPYDGPCVYLQVTMRTFAYYGGC